MGRNKDVKEFMDNVKKTLECIKYDNKKRDNRVDSLENNLSELMSDMKENRRMTEEMYKVFTSANFMLTVTLKFFGAIGVISASVLGIIELFKRVKGGD